MNKKQKLAFEKLLDDLKNNSLNADYFYAGTFALDSGNLDDVDAIALAKALAQTTLPITTLCITSSFFKDEGAKELALVLQEFGDLKTLDFSGNQIGDEGAKALAHAIPKLNHLTQLNLSGNCIGDEGGEAIAQMLEKGYNTTLIDIDLDFTNIFSESILSRINFYIQRNKDWTPAERIANRVVVIEPEGFMNLKQAIQNNLPSEYIDSQGVLYLTNVQFNFDKVRVYGAEGVVRGDKEMVNKCTDPQGVLSPTNGVYDFDKESAMMTLIQMLSENTTVTTLHLCGTAIGDKGASALANVLRSNTTLTTLNLSNTRITDKGAILLSQALVNNKSLKHIDLSGNTIGPAGQRMLVAAVLRNRTLTKLDFTFTDGEMQQKVDEHLAKNLNNPAPKQTRRGMKL